MEKEKMPGFASDTFSQNRMRLVWQIARMDSFTEDEFWEVHIKNCKEAGEDICAISGITTLGEYLEDLAEYGGLRYEYGRYWTKRERR